MHKAQRCTCSQGVQINETIFFLRSDVKVKNEKYGFLPDLVAHACNPCTEEAEPGGSRVWHS